MKGALQEESGRLHRQENVERRLSLDLGLDRVRTKQHRCADPISTD